MVVLPFVTLWWMISHGRLYILPLSSFLLIKEWSTAVGPAGLPGHRAPGVKGQEVVPALIPLLWTEDSTVSEKPLRHPTAKTKICTTWSQSNFSPPSFCNNLTMLWFFFLNKKTFPGDLHQCEVKQNPFFCNNLSTGSWSLSALTWVSLHSRSAEPRLL